MTMSRGWGGGCCDHVLGGEGGVVTMSRGRGVLSTWSWGRGVVTMSSGGGGRRVL